MKVVTIQQTGYGEYFILIQKTKEFFRQKEISTPGWTVNFANPVSIGAMIALLAAMVLITNSIKQH